MTDYMKICVVLLPYLLCAIGAVTVLSYFVIDTIKPIGYPPGPRWYPIIGCYSKVKKLLTKKKYYYLVWEHMRQKYGTIVGLRLGSNRIVLVSGYEEIKAVLSQEVFEGRPDGFFFRLRSFGQRLGVVFVDGPLMQEQRQFSLQQLRQMGLGKTLMSELITKEAIELSNVINEKRKKGSVSVNKLFDVSVLNSLWTMVSGNRFSLDDKRLARMLNLVHRSFKLVDMSGGLLNQMPFLRFIAPKLCGYHSLSSIVAEMMQFLKEVVEDTLKNNTYGNNFINVYMREIQDNGSSSENAFTEKQLLVVLEDLFMAGMETTTSTLSFAMLYLIKYPHIQSRIQKELDEVVGNDRLPNIRDRTRLTYLRAVIMEIQRHANVVPIAIPHRALNDTLLLGYNIPKDTVILANMYSVHMDETYWTNPTEFNPDRFINKNGDVIEYNRLIPFGIGRRRCIGESLAKTTLFLFLAILLQRFTITKPSQEAELGTILDGVTLAPAPFKVCFTPRSDQENNIYENEQ